MFFVFHLHACQGLTEHHAAMFYLRHHYHDGNHPRRPEQIVNHVVSAITSGGQFGCQHGNINIIIMQEVWTKLRRYCLAKGQLKIIIRADHHAPLFTDPQLR